MRNIKIKMGETICTAVTRREQKAKKPQKPFFPLKGHRGQGLKKSKK